MKKLLLSFSALLMIGSASAQNVDTLYEHYVGDAVYYGVGTGGTGGYVFGNNSYGDLAKGMRFNSANGLTNTGFLTDVLVNVGGKVGTGDVVFTVYEWSATDTIGAQLGTVTVPLADIDTALADGMLVNGRDYNNKITFTTPIAIPASKDILIFAYLPDYETGGVIFSSNESDDFPNAATHTWEIWEDGVVKDVANAWANGSVLFNAAMSMFPIVDMVAGINENVISSSVYPNPAKDMLNITASEDIVSVSITTMDGKSVATADASSVNVAGLSNGMYIYTATTASGKVARGTFAKN